MVSKSFVSAPGKVILSGEHSVVHGQPALLAAINRRLFIEIEKSQDGMEIITTEPRELAAYALQKTSEFLGKKIDYLKIKIHSQIPVKRGLGSSAALSVTMVGALFQWLAKARDLNLINQIAFEIEKKQHGRPSGADNSIVLYGGFLFFQKGKLEKFKVNHLPEFILLDSGRASESTKEMVSLANKKAPVIFEKMGRVTLRLIELLKKTRQFGDLNELIRENEKFLENLGVVGQKAKRIIKQIEALGGAAKVCGAGGVKKGSGILLCYHPEPRIILNFAQKNQIPRFRLKLGEEGLRNED